MKPGRLKRNRIEVSLKRTSPNHNESHYDADEIDAHAVYTSDINRSFWIPFAEAFDSSLRICHTGDAEIDHTPIRWGEEYDLAARLP